VILHGFLYVYQRVNMFANKHNKQSWFGLQKCCRVGAQHSPGVEARNCVMWMVSESIIYTLEQKLKPKDGFGKSSLYSLCQTNPSFYNSEGCFCFWENLDQDKTFTHRFPKWLISHWEHRNHRQQITILLGGSSHLAGYIPGDFSGISRLNPITTGVN